MDNLFNQGKAIGVAAREVLALEQKAAKLKNQQQSIEDDIENSRVALFDLVVALQDSTPHELPGLFTINGLIIDITGKSGHIAIHKAPELANFFECMADQNS